MTPDSVYDRSIQELEGKARDLEAQKRDIGRQLARLNGILSNLRDLAAADRRASLPAQPVHTAQPVQTPANGQPSLPPPVGNDAPRYVATSSYQKGDIIKLVIGALEERPGMRSSELGDLLKDKVTSGAKNPRKLIINAVSYLASTKRVRKLPQGGWELLKP